MASEKNNEMTLFLVTQSDGDEDVVVGMGTSEKSAIADARREVSGDACLVEVDGEEACELYSYIQAGGRVELRYDSSVSAEHMGRYKARVGNMGGYKVLWVNQIRDIDI